MTRAIPVFALALGLAAVGCKGDRLSGESDGVYEVNGVVEALPNDRDAMLHIAHEDIPDFVARDGKHNGMPAMTMPFSVGDGVDVSGFTKGDAIRFTFEVRWGSKHVLTVTKIAKTVPNDPETR